MAEIERSYFVVRNGNDFEGALICRTDKGYKWKYQFPDLADESHQHYANPDIAENYLRLRLEAILNIDVFQKHWTWAKRLLQRIDVNKFELIG